MGFSNVHWNDAELEDGWLDVGWKKKNQSREVIQNFRVCDYGPVYDKALFKHHEEK